MITCSGCIFSEYKTYTLKKDDVRFRLGGTVLEHPRFTFEYPNKFQLLDLNKAWDIEYQTRITLIEFHRQEPGETIGSEIDVAVFKPELELDDFISTAFLNAVLTTTSTNYTISNLEILVEKTVTVSGIPADYYICKLGREIQNGNEKAPSSYIFLLTYFEYADLRWEILLRSYEEYTKEMTTYFDHIIETFKILD